MSPFVKDAKQDVTGRAELSKGSHLLLVSPGSCSPDICDVSQETALLYKGALCRERFLSSERNLWAEEGREVVLVLK